MKTASSVGTKWQQKAGSSGQDYLTGVQNTSKDQAAAAIAAKGNYAAGVQAAISAGRYEKGLGKSGKSGWQAGVAQKGGQNYQTGVSAAGSLSKYTTNSGLYDSARGAAASVARGPKGSSGHLARVAAVVTAERAGKTRA